MTLCFSPKDPLETIVLTFDFALLLADGETITSGNWIVDCETATEDTSAMFSGITDISAAPLVRQKITGGTHGQNYMHRAKIVTTEGRTLVSGALQSVKRGAEL